MVALRPGRTSITLGARTRFDTDPPLVFEAPGGLIPMRIATFELDEYRMKNGWPTEIPPFDIRSPSLCSAAGEKLSYRPQPEEILTGAIQRWIADEDAFNVTDLAWRAVQRGLDLEWRSSVEYMPTLITDYSYRINSERFVRKALNFDSDTRNHMWMDMTSVINPIGCTVIMVLNPNSSFGNDVSVPYNGLWCFGRETPVGDTFTETTDDFVNVLMMGNFIFLETESMAMTKGPGINDQLRSNSPMYLAMSLGRPTTSIYVGSGPSSMHRVSIPTGENPVPLNTEVVLGRSTGDVLHTADMALFEVDLYAEVLTDAQIISEISNLSVVYGGDS